MSIVTPPRAPDRQQAERIDLAAVAADADLTKIIETDLGSPDRRGAWLCPFHTDRVPNLHITPDGVHFKCWSCGARGDALEWLVQRRGITVVEAAKLLAGDAPALGKSRDAGRTPRSSTKPTIPAWQVPEWQTAVDSIVRRAEWHLRRRVGRDAYRWLRDRGLDAKTIRRHRLGFWPEEWQGRALDCLREGRGRPLAPRMMRGIVIPWLAPGSWFSRADDPDGAEPGPRWLGLKVRRLGWDVNAPLPAGEPKCVQFKGSALTGYLYPQPGLLPCQGPAPTLIVEGEPDALVGTQYLGHVVHVLTAGGATTTQLRRESMQALALCPWVLICTDRDQAGTTAAWEWAKLYPQKSRRVLLPHGKDLNDFILAGGDPVAWLRGEFERFGWPWPLRSEPGPGTPIIGETSPRHEPGPVTGMVRTLNDRGMRLDGEMTHPRIAVGTVTGRITYTDPPVQTWPATRRLERIGPVIDGRSFVRADYGQIEPRIMLEILRRRGLIAWQAGADLYRTLAGAADRDTAKVAVNTLINGGSPPSGATGRLAEFIEATEAYRAVAVAEARERGYVLTLANRAIPLLFNADNFGGKAINRVVQGTAADVFNRAACRVASRIVAEGLPAAVAFLLFDELWVESDPGNLARVEDLIGQEMTAAAAADGLTIPVVIDKSP